MEATNERRGHRRPWWQFNVVPLFVALFVLVWVRHLTEMSQLATILWTLAVLVGWVALGFLGLYMRAFGNAGLGKRVRLLVYVATPLGLLAWWGNAAHRQAAAVEAILSRRSVQPMVRFADGLAINMLGKDRSFRRYWGRVTHVRLRQADSAILSQLTRLDHLQALSCGVAPAHIRRLLQLDKLRDLELQLRGPADLTPLSDARRLESITIHWVESWDSRSLQSLADLPVDQLHLYGPGQLSDQDVQTVLSLPSATLFLNGLALTKRQAEQLARNGVIVP